MKYFFCFVFCFYFIGCFSQTYRKGCSRNSDTLYNRKQVLDSICDKLNEMNERYLTNHPIGYYVEKENFYNFFIYDLVDTLNTSRNITKKCIEFRDEHIYHIASGNAYYKVSIILFLSKGNLCFFYGLNCWEKIHDISEVIEYIQRYPNLSSNHNVIQRLHNYKEYDLSYAIDPIGKTPKCECESK